jgi:hypothetical protein
MKWLWGHNEEALRMGKMLALDMRICLLLGKWLIHIMAFTSNC